MKPKPPIEPQLFILRAAVIAHDPTNPSQARHMLMLSLVGEGNAK